jgi:hypothetical protein
MGRVVLGSFTGAVVGGFLGCILSLAIAFDAAFLGIGNYAPVGEYLAVGLRALFLICVIPAAIVGAIVGGLMATVRRRKDRID